MVVLDAGLLPRCLEIVGRDAGFDAVLVNMDPLREPGANQVFSEERLSLLARALDGIGKFAFVASSAAGELTAYGRELNLRLGLHFANGFPFAVKALDHAIAYGAARARLRRARPIDTTALPTLPSPPGGEGSRERRHVLDEAESRKLLEAIGIPVPPLRVAHSAEQAAALAAEAGFPVVLKLLAPGIAHKTRVGGVRIGLGSEAAVRAAYAEIVKAVPEAEGVLVDRQVFPQAELIIGISRDAQFGPVVLAGSGGVLVEQLEDTALRLPPFDEDDALEMLAELRGRPTGDLTAVAGALVRLGLAALEWPQLLELDVNPLFLLEDGSVLAGDALAVLDRTRARQ